MRLRPPDFTLSELRSQPRSPLVQLQQILCEDGWETDVRKQSRVITSLKFLRAILNNQLNRRLRRMDPNTGRTISNPATHVSAEAERFLQEISDFAGYFHSIIDRWKRQKLGARIIQNYRLTDESISLLLDEGYLTAYLLVEQYVHNEKSRLQEALTAQIEQETEYRQARVWVPTAPKF